MEIKKFRNFTDRDFSWKFDGIEYTFKAGQEVSLEGVRADHFAKHLVDRELNQSRIITSNLVERNKLLAKCFSLDEPIVPLEVPHETEGTKKEEIEEEFPELKRRGRPKKI